MPKMEDLVVADENRLDHEAEQDKLYTKVVNAIILGLTDDELIKFHEYWDSDSSHDLYWTFVVEFAKLHPELFSQGGLHG